MVEKFGSDGPMMSDLFGSIVPLGRPIFLMIPGTSCLATIMQSLRDKNHSLIAAPRNELSSHSSWRKPSRVADSMKD
jgi:hypothetical protein